MVTDYLRGYVREECNKSLVTKELFNNHIRLVAEYGIKLAKFYNADIQIVELSSYLHDFTVIHNFEHPHEHAIKGSGIADSLLKQFKYSDDIISRVNSTIASHIKHKGGDFDSNEALCLYNADIMSQLSKPLYWIYYSHTVKGRDYEEGIKTYLSWVEGKWQTMTEYAQKMMQQEYALIKALKL